VKLTGEEITKGLAILGVTAEDFLLIRAASNYSEACRALDSVKEKAKKGYRQSALSLHPDKVAGDETLFRVVRQVYERIEDLEVHEVRRTRRRRSVISLFGGLINVEVR
jgi:hypothetical protein